MNINIEKLEIEEILDYLDDQIDRTEESAQAWDLVTKILPREIDKIRDMIESKDGMSDEYA
jgi:hypothetical protein